MRASNALTLAIVISLVILTGCTTAKEARRGQLNEYENQFRNAELRTEGAYDAFTATLTLKEKHQFGVATTMGWKPEPLTGEAYIEALNDNVKTFSSEYSTFSIVANEYYSFLTTNEAALIKDGVNVAAKKIAIQEKKASMEEKKTAINTSLTTLAEQEQAQQQAIANILQLLFTLA